MLVLGCRDWQKETLKAELRRQFAGTRCTSAP